MVIIMNTTISISEDVKKEIIKFGAKGETYNQILRRILDNAKERQLQELLMDEKDCVPIDDALKRAKKRWQR